MSIEDLGAGVSHEEVPKVIIELLAPLAVLDDDWDGNGALAPTAGVLRVATDLLGVWMKDAPPPQAMASVGGGVLLEWESYEADLVIEVGVDDSVNVFVRVRGVEYEGPLHEHQQNAEHALALLTSTG